MERKNLYIFSKNSYSFKQQQKQLQQYIIIIIIIIIYYLRVFHISFSWWFFTGV